MTKTKTKEEIRKGEETPAKAGAPTGEPGKGQGGAADGAGAEGAGADAAGQAGDAGESPDAKYLRLAADFQNYKKRTEKERFERYSDGKKDFAADILPILDNFDRALAQNAAQAADEHDRAVIEGMEMVLKQFIDVLAKNGVAEIEALGADFDPNAHHAVMMEPSDEYESQKVSAVLQKGYRIGEKVIRPAMVKVAQ
ncbi:MAG: nucleotide exchange factor GrpE [Clostridiales Family XIII bacterium]|jgi:molecular chaperone GrpE|nr:nucleotide exchange factor GrpE [Clostridiales Family XIII bacterium]